VFEHMAGTLIACEAANDRHATAGVRSLFRDGTTDGFVVLVDDHRGVTGILVVMCIVPHPVALRCSSHNAFCTTRSTSW
jgi:hypothetical protein